MTFISMYELLTMTAINKVTVSADSYSSVEKCDTLGFEWIPHSVRSSDGTNLLFHSFSAQGFVNQFYL